MPAIVPNSLLRTARSLFTLLLVTALAVPALLVVDRASAQAATATQVLNEAARHAGKPYRWGATGPSSFDCSGYTGYVFRQLGVHLPRTSQQQRAHLPRVPQDQKRPGDLIFTHNSSGTVYHVGIYAGNNQMWHSPRSGSVVNRSSIFSRSYTVGRTPLQTGPPPTAIDNHYRAIGGANSGLGNPTTGEYQLANGRGRSYGNGQILAHNAIGPRAVQGRIHGLFGSMGYERGFLGYPTSDEYPIVGGRASNFQGGTVAWSPATGAREVHGAILAEWRRLGGTTSALRFPTSNEVPAGPGRMNSFQGGSILWTHSTGAKPVYGTIHTRYRATGGHNSPLGFPTTGEIRVPGGMAQQFRNGTIFWDARTGRASELTAQILETYNARGGPGGPLGMPLGPQQATANGSQAEFVGGVIAYNAQRNATSVTPR
jgi:hypothetical protein